MADRGARPDYQDALETIEKARAQAGERLEVRVLGRSVEGREIPCVLCTDPTVSDEDKQRVFLVASQHGSEESGRAMTLALLEFLASGGPEADEILRRQVVAIAPCANPDGAQRDTSRNAEGVDVAHTYAFDGPAGSPEGRALETFALAFAPEVFVDAHGRAGGGMKELAWLSPAWRFSSDRYFLTIMSAEMARAGEEAGYPQCEVAPPGELNLQESAGLLLGAKLAAEVKSLSFGLESIEQYYREQEWRATGLVRLRRLLRFGMEDFFGLGRPGYPNMLISGSRIYGLVAHGATAATRRTNRVEMTRFVRHNFCLAERGEDGRDRCARMVVSSETCQGPNPDRFALLLRIKKPCRVQSVEWQDRALGRGTEHGYQMWEDASSVLVQANILEPFGGPRRALTVRYESPLFGG